MTANTKTLSAVFKSLTASAASSFVFLVCLFLATLSLWAQNTFDELSFEQIITNTRNINFNQELFSLFPEIKTYLKVAAAAYVLLLLFLDNSKLLKLSALCTAYIIYAIGYIPHLYYNNTKTTLYEEHYATPEITAADFPAQKRNLLVIYLESVEKNFAKPELYGKNLLPSLSRLATENPHFDNYTSLYGTNYTKGALIAGLCGIPNRTATEKGFNGQIFEYSNIVCLSDILAQNGYETWFAKSADHHFARTDIFYKNHAYQNIIDHTYLTRGLTADEIKAAEGSYNGLNDRLLFKNITELFTTNKVKEPFLMTLFTVDTHAPGTVYPSHCPHIFNDIRDNVLCTDENITAFLEKFQQTPYYADTSIVILGDHLMFKALPTLNRQKVRRGIYNVFLNIPEELKEKYSKNKPFTALDMAPSFAEILNIKLKNHAFGLGRSLFSDVPSLITDKKLNLRQAIRQKSDFAQKFHIKELAAKDFHPYTPGTVLYNRDIPHYSGYSEEALDEYYTDNLLLKLPERPTKDLTLKLTFKAMLSLKPKLNIWLNGKLLTSEMLTTSSGEKTITLKIPAALINKDELALSFQNNNYRSTISQTINICKFVLQ